MKNPLNTTAALDAGLLLSRAPLGVYLAWVGYRQWADDGLGAFAARHQAALSKLLPPALAGGLLYLTPIAEVVAGLLLVFGLFSRVGGLLATVSLAVLVVAVYDFRPADGLPFDPLWVYGGFALFLSVAGPGGFSVDRVLFGNTGPAGR